MWKTEIVSGVCGCAGIGVGIVIEIVVRCGGYGSIGIEVVIVVGCEACGCIRIVVVIMGGCGFCVWFAKDIEEL